MVFMRDRVSDWGLYLVQCRRLGKVIVFRLLMMMQYVSSSVLYCIQSDLKKVFRLGLGCRGGLGLGLGSNPRVNPHPNTN